MMRELTKSEEMMAIVAGLLFLALTIYMIVQRKYEMACDEIGGVVVAGHCVDAGSLKDWRKE